MRESVDQYSIFQNVNIINIAVVLLFHSLSLEIILLFHIKNQFRICC